LIEECRACGKQHSILAGTIVEQTKTSLSRWFLAIYLVTSSKGGLSAMELQRQMGFGSYQTAKPNLNSARWILADFLNQAVDFVEVGFRPVPLCGAK
jgi:hypothetical protein